MASKQTFGLKGKVIHSQAQEIIANVLQFMKEESENGLKIPLTNFNKRVLMATQIREETCRKIRFEAKAVQSVESSCFTSPRRKKPISDKPKSDLHEGQIETIRSIIHNFHIVEKRRPILKGSKSGDYHDDMNHKNFMTWIKRQLLPNLPPRACIVIDNASYHNVTVNRDPTSASKKQELVNWLMERNIAHDPTKTKSEFYYIISQHKGQHKQFVLDIELVKHNHCVLRLPPYHPELNPAEKIWALLKTWVAARNIIFKLSDVMELAKQRFSEVTGEDWAKVCEHADKVAYSYVEKEHLLDTANDSLLTNLCDSNDDVDDYKSDESDDF